MNAVQPECPFCLQNNLLAVPIMAETEGGYLTKAMSHPGNYLIIPRSHAQSVADLPDDWMRDFKQLIAQIPGLDQFNVSLNIGKHAGQTLGHVHFWIVPRTETELAAGKGLVSLMNKANAR